jgi:hypothetical protein
MTVNESDRLRIERIFFPNVTAARERVQSDGGRFVYYTTADVAMRIIRNREIWMRSTMTMMDYMEVEHGTRCLLSARQTEAGKEISNTLDECFSSLASEVDSQIDAWIPGFRYDTFITCVSEHSSGEDTLGRLSMWRAYGGNAGVALVINSDVMFRESDALAAYSMPVDYMNESDFGSRLNQVAVAVRDNKEYVQSLGRDRIKNIVFSMLRFAALCTKHPGFSEEREWRVIASPALQSSDLLMQGVETIRGIPQTVLKLPLQNQPTQNLAGLALPDLIDRVIIGPCEFPAVMRRAFWQLLSDAGVPNPSERVFVSDIPLRHS